MAGDVPLPHSDGWYAVSVDLLTSLRDRFLPMAQLVAVEYADRVPAGYPLVVDTPERGAIGLELDGNHAVYLTSDGDAVWADLYIRQPRNDTRGGASRARFGGTPRNERRPITAETTDYELRNLVSELMTRYNFQPGIIHITET